MPLRPPAVSKTPTPVTSPPRPFPVPPASRKSGRRPTFVLRLQEFWNRVTEGLALNQLWSQFKRDAQSSYRLYSRDFQAGAPEETRRHNFWHTAQEFSWAILGKLTPARRVLLLVGVALLDFPAGGFRYHGKAREAEAVKLDFRFFGCASIFLVVMLQNSARVEI